MSADEDTEKIEAAFRASPLFRELERINSEEESSYFESQAKRQHFIPRLMLKRFARESDGKLFIFQLEVKTGTPRRVQIEDAASRRYFYALSQQLPPPLRRRERRRDRGVPSTDDEDARDGRNRFLRSSRTSSAAWHKYR
jgi:Protein of unknown function (DUF4238)